MVFPPSSNCELGEKLFTIEDLKEVADLSKQLATASGGYVDHFMVEQDILCKLDNNGKIEVLERKQEALNEAPWENTCPDQTPESLLQLELQEFLPLSPESCATTANFSTAKPLQVERIARQLYTSQP